jgi:hypothetical protein
VTSVYDNEKAPFEQSAKRTICVSAVEINSHSKFEHEHFYV